MTTEDDLPNWFYRLSPLTMDAQKGPGEQYRAGARDMLASVRELLDARADTTGVVKLELSTHVAQLLVTEINGLWGGSGLVLRRIPPTLRAFRHELMASLISKP